MPATNAYQISMRKMIIIVAAIVAVLVSANLYLLQDVSAAVISGNCVDPADIKPIDNSGRYCYSIPCGPKDDERKVFTVDGLGQFCIERTIRDVIKHELKRGKRWEPEVVALLTEYVKKGMRVIDVGAHIGTHTIAMARLVGDEGLVFAFEPQVKIYQELLVNLDLNEITNVHTYFAALGESQSRISMIPPPVYNEGHASVGEGGNRVELKTLDSYQFTDVSVIKIDVEGAENGVLKGARQTITQNKPVILIEIMGGHDFDSATPEVKAKIQSTLDLLAELGYETTKVQEHNYVALPRGR